MNLGKLQDRLETTNNSEFLNMYQLETLDGFNTVDNTVERLKEIFEAADNYAKDNDLKYKYFQLAKKPLWTEFTVESESFIYQGFDAQVSIDLSENLDNLKLFVVVQNNNVKSLQEGQRIEINSDFVDGLNVLQRNIFEEASLEVQKRATDTFRKVWLHEKERMDKWVKTCSIQLKGN